jgi:hypothetical protein
MTHLATTTANTAERTRRAYLTARNRPARPIPNRAVAWLWRPATPTSHALLPATAATLVWNTLRAVVARTHPTRRTVPRLAGWVVLTAVAYLAAVLLAAVVVVTAPVWWTLGQAVGAGLIVAGWTPPLRLDTAPTDLDLRALTDADYLTYRPLDLHVNHQPSPNTLDPRAGLEERQVRAAEANATTLHHLAHIEATRPAPTGPVITHYRTNGLTFRRFLAAWAVMVILFVALVAFGASQGPHRYDPNPFLTTPSTTTGN